MGQGNGMPARVCAAPGAGAGLWASGQRPGDCSSDQHWAVVTAVVTLGRLCNSLSLHFLISQVGDNNSSCFPGRRCSASAEAGSGRCDLNHDLTKYPGCKSCMLGEMADKMRCLCL